MVIWRESIICADSKMLSKLSCGMARGVQCPWGPGREDKAWYLHTRLSDVCCTPDTC